MTRCVRFCSTSLLGLSLAALLASCGGRGSAEIQGIGRGLPSASSAPDAARTDLQPDPFMQPQVGGLASPLEMLRQASTGPSDTDRLLGYNYYDPALPHARIAVNNGQSFTPVGSSRLDEAAFCVYHFSNLTGYSGPQHLQFAWSVPPAPGSLFIGLSDFGGKRWRWFSPQDPTLLEPGSLDQFVSDTGDMLMTVLVAGTQEATIGWVLFGGSVFTGYGLSGNLKIDPALNTAPLAVDFTAYHVIMGGQVVSYDWDFDSDANYEIEDSVSNQASFVYDQPGLYTATVHMVTDDGNSQTASLTFTAVDTSNIGPSASVETSPLVSDGPAAISLDASGSSDPDGQIIKYEWDFNNDGVYDFDSGNDPSISHIFARKGLDFYKVRVTDNDYATATALGAVTINSGWSTATVSSGYGYVYNISASTTGVGKAERPCLAFHNSPADLHFVRALVADGSDWEAVQSPIDNSGTVGIAPALLRSSLTSNPLLFYSVADSSSNSLSLHLVKAANSAGTAWSAPIDIDTELNVGSRSCAFMQDGVPALFSVSSGPASTSQVYYYKAGDASAQDWNFRRLVASAPEGSFFNSLAGAFGAAPLAVAVIDSNSPGYSRALSQDGDNWSGFTDLETLNCPQICASSVNGSPAIAQLHGSQIYYRRAGDANGSFWTSDPVVIDAPKVVYPAALKAVAGKPALAWLSGDGDGVYLAEATDINGAVWSEPYAIVTSTGLGDALDLTECQGNPVVIYSNQEDDTIEAAIFIP